MSAALRILSTPAQAPEQLHRFNTRKCAACGTVTSLLARPVKAEWKFGGVRRGAFVGESGSVVGHEHVLGHPGYMIVPCRSCGKNRIAEQVLGKVRADKKCDGRCTHATGHTCECSCGGKNHGAAHG